MLGRAGVDAMLVLIIRSLSRDLRDASSPTGDAGFARLECRKVIDRRRRGGGPFERPCVPRIRPRDCALGDKTTARLKTKQPMADEPER